MTIIPLSTHIDSMDADLIAFIEDIGIVGIPMNYMENTNMKITKRSFVG